MNFVNIYKFESFGWILLNPEFICVIGTTPTYLGKWEKRVNFGNGVAEIQQKYEREREKVGERKFWILIMWLPKFLLSEPTARVCAVCSKCEVLKKETNCGNAIAEIGEKKLWQLWQCHCRKWEGKKKIEVGALSDTTKMKALVSECTFSSLQMDFNFFFLTRL